jgi:hypothetical protein
MRLLLCASLLVIGLVGCATSDNQTALPSAPPIGEPGNLAGMDASRIRVAFGPPQFIRKDGQIEMWRYDGPNCKAFFFLYPAGPSLAVKHVETLPHQANAAADASCLQGLLSRPKAVS